MSTISYRPVQEKDLQALADILNYYVLNSTVTFHIKELAAEGMREKLFFGNSIYGSYIIKYGNEMAGYCTLSPWKNKKLTVVQQK